ncbi:Endonuclease/exonuclease/phosphatase [Lipomyces arxii]|uniref:Endonuclease/exonuclease/phosphatase n=1 Tax=Lipomyces arxii TaxID=56418 RepID=UPI0034CF1CDB
MALVLTTSSHTISFTPADSAHQAAYRLSEIGSVASQLIDLTVHDTISIDESADDSDLLTLKFQENDIGFISKENAAELAEFVLAWRSALAALEEQVPISRVSAFPDPLNSDYVTAGLVREKTAFFEEKVVSIRLVTWNLHGEIIGEDLRPLFFGSNESDGAEQLQDLEIYFVALQEADPLSPTTLSANQVTISRWIKQITEALGSSSVHIASSELLGMVLLMFSHRKLASQITDLEISSAGTGVFGYWGNKGAVCIKFMLGANPITGSDGVEIAVINMHLSSGINMQALERRRWEMNELERRLKLPIFNGKLCCKPRNGGKNRTELLYQNGELLDELDGRFLDLDMNDDNATTPTEEKQSITPASVDSEDKAATTSVSTGMTATTAVTINSDQVGPERQMNSIVFVMGDLNYRLSMDRNDVELLVSKSDYDALLFWDQLRNEIKDGLVLIGFQEGPISFPPTYKYDIGTNTFDTSEKARVPAYTDRILYTPYPSLAQLDYEPMAHYISSDHKPIVASFELRTMLIDVDKRGELVKRLLHDMDARENESRPRAEVEQTEYEISDLKVFSTVNQNVKFRNSGNTQIAWEIEPVEGTLLTFNRLDGILPPGVTQTIRVKFIVPPLTSKIAEIFILRIVNRQDYFISIGGDVAPSCFGASLDDMIRKPSGAVNGISDQAGPQLNIPREIWKCVDYLSTRITKDVFRRPGDEIVGQLVRDWLDKGEDFDVTVLDSLASDGNKGVHSVAEQFLLLLQFVVGGVIPESAYDTLLQGKNGVQVIFEVIPRVNVNTLIYIASFLREVKRSVIDFDLILDMFDKVLVRIPRSGKIRTRHKVKRMEFFKAFIG